MKNCFALVLALVYLIVLSGVALALPYGPTDPAPADPPKPPGPAGPGPAGPAACGEIITESTVLTEDLHCPYHGLHIGADEIMLDCDGYAIYGPSLGLSDVGPIGINLTGRNSVVVQNCKVEGFGTNIYLYNSTMNMLLQNEVSRGVFGIYLDGSSYNTLFNNTANYNNFTGVELYSGSEYNTVKYCEASHTSTVDVWVAGSGFEVSNSNYNYLGDNNASYNRMDCFNLKSSGHNYLENNLAYNCTTGFELRLALHNTLLGNNATHNVNGMSLVAAYNKVENNEIEWNDEHGIKMKVTDNNVIANNTILGNQIGIGISEEFATNNHNAIGQNTLMQNAYGLLLKGEWMQNEVFENTFVDNTEYGAYLVKSSGLEPTLNSFWMNVFIAQPMHTAYEGENVTMNRWDLGYNYSGNYWSDFELNPGYPNHYEIHGPGDGIDNYPVS